MALEMDSTYLAGRLFATLLTFFALKVFFFPWLIEHLHQPKIEVSSKNDLPADSGVLKSTATTSN